MRFLLCSAVQFDGVFAVGDAGGGHGFTGGVFAQKTYLTMHTRIVTTIGIALALGAVESKAALQLTTANSAQHYLGSDNLGISGLLSNYGYVTGGLLYKHAPNDTPQETGTLAGSYNTVYVPNNEGTTTITHVAGDYANATYLVLKDGVTRTATAAPGFGTWPPWGGMARTRSTSMMSSDRKAMAFPTWNSTEPWSLRALCPNLRPTSPLPCSPCPSSRRSAG